MNKEIYEKPDMEIIKLVREEVITESKGELPIDPHSLDYPM